MMNPFALQKLQRRFSTANQNESDSDPLMETEEPDESGETGIPDIEALLQDSESLNNLRSHLENAPKREDYKPSIGKRLASALLAGATGFTSGAKAGVDLGEKLINDPFERAQSDFNSKSKRLQDVAALDERGNLRKGNILSKFQSEYDRAENQKRIDEDRDENRRRLEIEAQNRDEDRKSDNDRFERQLEISRQSNSETAKERAQHNREMESIGRGNLEARKTSSGNSDRRMEMATRKAYESEMKEVRHQEESFSKVRELGKTATGPADVALLMQFTHGIDDTASREGEVRTAQSARALSTKIENYIENLKTGRKLDPATVQQFVDAAEVLYNSYAKPRKKQIQDNYRQLSSDYGFDPRHIMSDLEEPKKGPNPEWDAEFQKKFGPKGK